jgi:transmembrane sensor
MIRELLTLDRLRSMTPKAAAALIALHQAERVSGEDAVVAQWLSLDPAHEQAWARAQRAWAGFDKADDDELLAAMLRAARTARPVRTSPGARWAAGIAVVAVLGGLLVVGQRVIVGSRGSNPVVAAQGDSQAGPRQVQAYAVGRAQPRVFVLADGSRLTLDANSTVTAAYAVDKREVTLAQGRAFFDVAHDARRPFSVRAGSQDITAVGTRFDVRLDPESVHVVLVEGRLSVSSPGAASSPTLLGAGQQLVAQAGKAPVVSAADLDEALNWQRGLITFHNDSLAAAVAMLNRYSQDQLVVRDPRIGRLRISGMFRVGDVGRFGRALAQVHPVRIVQTAPHRFEIVAAR